MSSYPSPQLDFESALLDLIDGKKVRRKCWRDARSYLKIVGEGLNAEIRLFHGDDPKDALWRPLVMDYRATGR